MGNGSNGWIAVEYHFKSLGLYPQIFRLDIQSLIKFMSPETKKSNMATGRPFWKWHCWKSIGFSPQPQMTYIWNLKFQSKLLLCSGNHATYRVYKRKIKYGHQVDILKMILLKMDKLLPIYTSIVLLKFRVDIQSQTRVWKQKNPIWLPSGHFESDIAKNQ